MADEASTYSGDPQRLTRDLVRYLAGDVGKDGEWLSTDAEVAWEILQTRDALNANAERPYQAATALLEHNIAKVAQRVSVTDGDAQKALSDQIKNMEIALDRLNAQAVSREGASAYGQVPSGAGRVSLDDGPYFGVGMMASPYDPTPRVEPPDLFGDNLASVLPTGEDAI